MKLAWVLGIAVSGLAQSSPRDFGEAQQFLGKYCSACHGKAPTGGFALDRIKDPSSFLKETHSWQRLMARIEAGDMPPKNMPSPNEAAREGFNKWVKDSLHREACAGGIRIGPRPIRRLNREEYTATVQQLLDIHMDIGANLPADGAGGEGFDNAAETLFLSPLHAEKYLETARLAMDFAAKEYKSRARILVAKPDAKTTPQAAARKILANFLPKAFRRPVSEAELAPYLSLYTQARAQGDDFEPGVFFMLRAVLVSPQFLFRQEPAPYALASRLSYFLWGSQPNELLMDLARRGDLAKPEVLRALIPRMLRDDRSHVFSKRFVEQWLHTRDLDGDKAPDARLYPEFTRNEDLRGDIRLQPVYFFREMLSRDLPITSLIDSDGTIATSHLAKHFGLALPLNRNANTQPQWVELPKNSGRGGILGMPAVLAVASYPYRSSPVLRGAFILDAILGTPPPAPPPNVPPLEEAAPGAAPKTVRERLSQHRANPSCAGCHSRIDPLGFALENYDPIGRWREEESGKPVDNSAEMPDGHKFAGPQALRSVLLAKQDLFLRNIASKLLGYALGRGLTLYDQCAVDAIVDEVKNNNYSSRRLIEAIVLSPPFLGESKP